MVHKIDEKKQALEKILLIMDDLRSQCPWDKKQTIASLRNLTIEEVYELADAISKEDSLAIEEELGDVLLHIIFYAKIGEEQGKFDLTTIIERLSKKLIFRHPHIYGDVKVHDEEEVKQNWEKLKLKEGKKSVLSGVPQNLPAMIKALRIQEKSAKIGFEWKEKSHVWDKVKEELDELKEAEQRGSHEDVFEEFGDVLFALINYARFIDVDPESALDSVNQKFIKRFGYIESNAGKPLEEMSLEEMELLWQSSKKYDKK